MERYDVGIASAHPHPVLAAQHSQAVDFIETGGAPLGLALDTSTCTSPSRPEYVGRYARLDRLVRLADAPAGYVETLRDHPPSPGYGVIPLGDIVARCGLAPTPPRGGLSAAGGPTRRRW